MFLYRAKMYFETDAKTDNGTPLWVLQNQLFVISKHKGVDFGGGRFLPKPSKQLLDEKRLENNSDYWKDEFYERLDIESLDSGKCVIY